MDGQTRRDYIEDLLEERVMLYEKLRQLEDTVTKLELETKILLERFGNGNVERVV